MSLSEVIQNALAEDAYDTDVTSQTFVAEALTGRASVVSRRPVVVSGLYVVESVFAAVDTQLAFVRLVEDGDIVEAGQEVATISGRVRSILAAERTALNFLCHLSGIATATHHFVEASRPWGTRILATRKTTPGLRELEIQAVRHGGGDVYRRNLADGVLLKDNHAAAVGGMEGIRRRLAELRAQDPLACEQLLHSGKIEADTLEELQEAVEMGWKHVLLDNFSPAAVHEAVRRWGRTVYLEVSGGVNEQNIVAYAETGVPAVSIGAITHSSRAADFSLELEGSRR